MPGIFTLRSLTASGALSSVGMRPARRSLMLPAASSVQKLARIATSPSCRCEADAGGFERAAADHVLQRVVAEQAQVPGAAAGADAGQHGNAAAQDAGFGERVEIGRVGRFQLGLAARLLRQAAQAVAHVHDDLGVVLDVQFAGKSVDIHGGGRWSEVGGQSSVIHRREIWFGCKGTWSSFQRSPIATVMRCVSVGGHAEFPANGLPQSSGLAAGAK